MKLAMYMQKAHAQAVTITDFGNSSSKKNPIAKLKCNPTRRFPTTKFLVDFMKNMDAALPALY